MYLGTTVLYRCRPGQERPDGRDWAAIVTREHADGSADLIIFPPRTRIADALQYERVAKMSDAVTGHCWHVSDDINKDIADLRAEVDALRAQLAYRGLAQGKPAKNKAA